MFKGTWALGINLGIRIMSAVGTVCAASGYGVCASCYFKSTLWRGLVGEFQDFAILLTGVISMPELFGTFKVVARPLALFSPKQADPKLRRSCHLQTGQILCCASVLCVVLHVKTFGGQSWVNLAIRITWLFSVGTVWTASGYAAAVDACFSSWRIYSSRTLQSTSASIQDNGSKATCGIFTWLRSKLVVTLHIESYWRSSKVNKSPWPGVKRSAIAAPGGVQAALATTDRICNLDTKHRICQQSHWLNNNETNIPNNLSSWHWHGRLQNFARESASFPSNNLNKSGSKYAVQA